MRRRLARDDPLDAPRVVPTLVVQHARCGAHAGTRRLVRIRAHQPRGEDERQPGPRVPLLAQVELVRPRRHRRCVVDHLVADEEHGVGARVERTGGMVEINERGLGALAVAEDQFGKRARRVAVGIGRHRAHLGPRRSRVEAHGHRVAAAAEHAHRHDEHRLRCAHRVDHRAERHVHLARHQAVDEARRDIRHQRAALQAREPVDERQRVQVTHHAQAHGGARCGRCDAGIGLGQQNGHPERVFTRTRPRPTPGTGIR